MDSGLFFTPRLVLSKAKELDEAIGGLLQAFCVGGAPS